MGPIENALPFMSTIEWIAAVFGFLCVWFYIQRNPWSWPTGLVQVALLIRVFYEAKLYADMGLHLVYVVLQIYGWWEWSRSQNPIVEDQPASRILVRTMPLYGWVIASAVSLLLTVLFASLLTRYTDATYPLIDSLIAAVSLVAQTLLAWRYLENWLLWIFVDILGIGLFAVKGLTPTAILYALFLIMAITGYVQWRSAFKNQTAGGELIA